MPLSPRISLPPRAPARRRTPAPASPSPRPPGRRASILLIDDDAAVLESLRRVLEGEGWEVIAAQGGIEALECLREREPDLIITDLCMSAVNGWDLLFHESLQRPHLPIFVITALSPASAAGADQFATAFFEKPLDLDRLITAIRRQVSAPGPAPAP